MPFQVMHTGRVEHPSTESTAEVMDSLSRALQSAASYRGGYEHLFAELAWSSSVHLCAASCQEKVTAYSSLVNVSSACTQVDNSHEAAVDMSTFLMNPVLMSETPGDAVLLSATLSSRVPSSCVLIHSESTKTIAWCALAST